MAKILNFTGETRLDIPVERVLDSAKHLETVIVIGEAETGELWFASSTSNGPLMLWLLEKFKKELLED